MNKAYHVKILLREFEKRKTKNKRYSLRAFAKFLGFAPSTLSRTLTNGQELSVSATKKIMKKLQLSEEERMLFTASVAESKKFQTLQMLTKVPGDGGKDFKFTFESIARMAMKHFCDGCIIHLNGSKNDAILHAKHKTGHFDGLSFNSLSTPIVCHPILSPEEPLIINMKDKHDEILTHLNAHSLLCVPVKKGEQLIGSVTLLRNKDKKTFAEDDVNAALSYAQKTTLVYELISEN